MNILIIGGTRFLGRGLVDAALERGHTITLFNRGKSNPGLYPQVETIIGDRDGGLDALEGRNWDTVIDTCGYFPRLVRDSAEYLKDKVGHYTFISSISAYASFDKDGLDENSPTGTIEDKTVEEITGETYGPLKVLCEEAVEEAFPGKALNIRPGLIVGPHDPTDRFTYWPVRVDQGGEVLCPGNGQQQVQVIDVRDLSEWTIRLVEEGATGVFNVTGPSGHYTMRELLETCQKVSRNESSLTWVSDDFLLENKLTPWMELPIWIPANDANMKGMMSASIDKALKSGLTFRSMETIVKDTVAWNHTRPADYEWQHVLKPQQEKELLVKWEKSQEG